MTAPQSNATSTELQSSGMGVAIETAAALALGMYFCVRALAGQFTPYSGETAFANMLVLMLAVFLGAGVSSLRAIPRLPETLVLVAVMFASVFLWGALRTPYAGAGIPQATDALLYLLLLLCGYFYARVEPRVLQVATRALIAMVVVQACAGIWQHFVDLPRLHAEVAQGSVALPQELQSGAGMRRLRGTDAFGSFGNPNSLAAYMLLGLGLLAGMLFSGARTAGVSPANELQARRLRYGRLWIAGAVAGLLLLLALALTNSKGGWVACAAGGWFFAVQRLALRHPSLRAPLKLLTIGALGVVFALLLLGTAGVLGDQPFGYSMEVRLDYWRSALKMIWDHPLQGVGLGGFSEHYTFYKMPLGEEVKDAHNDYVQLWAELGPLGLLVYLLPWVLVFRTRTAPLAPENSAHILRSERLERLALLGALAGFIIMYVIFAPLNAADIAALLRGEANAATTLGALQALALPVIFACVFIMLRAPGPATLLDDGWRHGFFAAAGALLVHQLVDFDFRAQAVMGGIFFLAGGHLAARQPALAGTGPGRLLEKYSPALLPVLGVALFMTAVWIPLRSGEPRIAAENAQLEAQQLAAELAAKGEHPLQDSIYRKLREEISELRREAVVAANFDADAWLDLAGALEAQRRTHPQQEFAPEIHLALKKAAEWRPLAPVPQALLGNFLLRNGDARKAAEQYARAAARYPLAPGLNLQRGDALFLQRAYLAAADEYLRALATDTQLADFNVRLASIFVDKNAGAFPRHGLDAAVLQGVNSALAAILAFEAGENAGDPDNPPENPGAPAPSEPRTLNEFELRHKQGLLVRRLVGMARIIHEEDEQKTGTAASRKKLTDELLWTGEALLGALPEGPQRAHAALLHALSFEQAIPDQKKEERGAAYKAAWQLARELQARSVQAHTPGTPARLFEQFSTRYGP